MEATNPYASPHEAGAIEPHIRPPGSLLEIITAGISLYIGNAPAVIGIMLLVMGPVELMQSYYEYFVASADEIVGPIRASFWLQNLIGIVPTAGIIAIGDAAMRGERPGIWFGLRAGLEAWPRMIGTRIVVTFISLLALVVFVIPGIYVAVRAALAEPVAVIEHAGALKSMQRSFELTLGRFWRFFFLTALYIVFMIVVGALVAIPAVMFPETDHWLLSASLSLLVDILAGLPVLIAVTAYWASAHPRAAAVPA